MRLVAGPKVEDPTAASLEATTAAEYLAAFEPADEHEPIWRRDIEVLAVHLLFIDRETIA